VQVSILSDLCSEIGGEEIIGRLISATKNISLFTFGTCCILRCLAYIVVSCLVCIVVSCLCVLLLVVFVCIVVSCLCVLLLVVLCVLLLVILRVLLLVVFVYCC